jgi:CDP-paratose 2-epimerase
MTDGPILITGGAGFIGSNIADSFLREGREVILFDVLARRGVSANLDWLLSRHGKLVTARIADVRDKEALEDAVRQAGAIIHLAAQVAVTTSLVAPQDDFAINGQGTLNLLEAVRKKGDGTPVLFASTNKVYGHLRELELAVESDQHLPVARDLKNFGISETQPLDFATPYGCSKGVADQYVLDYARTFGLRTAVLRKSCIYGPRQFGTEDQGWVAHFLIRALQGEPITIYGDGRQVRDILHVNDAVSAYRKVLDSISAVHGRVFNLGGGPDNAVSLRTMLCEIETIVGRALDVRFADWRRGDQLYFVADTRRLRDELGWTATIGWKQGLRDLAQWIADNSQIIRHVRAPEPERMIA